jgi:uncharacterized protein YegJ (DUF2314 family)
MGSIAAEAKRDAKWAVVGMAVCIWGLVKLHAPFAGVLAVAFAAEAVLLWKRKKAGAYLSFFTALCGAAFFSWLIYAKGFSWVRLALVGAMLFSLLSYWGSYGDLLRGKATWDDERNPDLRKPADEDSGDNDDEAKPMTSIVLLRSKPKFLDDKVLLEIIRDAWDPARKWTEEELFVAGESPVLMVRSPQGMWTLHNRPGTYFDDMSATERIPDLRLRKAVKEHEAWLAVDLMHSFDENLSPDLYYPYIFRLVRELADEDTLVIFRPETGQINIWSEEVANSLGSADPLEEFATPVHSPVIQVSDQDPRMKEAVAEARNSFEVFREHWKNRTPEDGFIVKASIKRMGNSEIIWILVTGLEPEFIHGTLANQPVDLDGLKAGDSVEVPVDDLYDWAVSLKDVTEPVGMFTEKVVRMVERELRSPGSKPV